MNEATENRQNVYGIVVGINRYLDDNIPSLKFARQDAEAIHQILVDPQL
ncbi:MAG: hypothetical protein GWN16_06245, partial [Calditrichae bacterium]|nr:hypothetical protein [Calditrichia bacterium]